MLDSYYFGMISEVYDPAHKRNSSKYQYEYQVVVTVEDYAQVPFRCIREDRYGTADDFEDIILTPGTKVMVKFPRGDRSVGVIQHGTRAAVAPMDPKLGRHWRNRFNKIVRYIDKDGNYSVTSDGGPNMHVKVDKIILDDSAGEQIILDKEKKTIFVNCKDFTIEVKQNVTMNVAKDSNIAIKGNANVSVEGDATVAVKGNVKVFGKNVEATAEQNMKAKCKELEAEASGNAKIKAKKIVLNEDMGEVLTTVTDPVVDTIFGVPTKGVKTVKAG